MSNGLEDILTTLGLDVKRQTGDELNCRCPVHYLYKGRPSDGYSFYINVDTGLWQCFTCGARGNLPTLVGQITNDTNAIMGVHLFMAQSNIDSFNRGDEEEEVVPADWQTYAAFDRVPTPLLEARDLDPDVAFRFGIRFNKKTKSLPNGDDRPDYKCIITPVMDAVGTLMGWQAKQGRYFTNVPTGVHKSESLFGYHYARGDTALLVESPLDVVRFHSVYKGTEIQAVSSYGASVSEFQRGMLTSRFDRLIMAMDNDDAGRLESARLSGLTRKSPVNLLTGYRKRVWWWDYSGTQVAKDIGDLHDQQILDGLDNITRTPPHDIQGLSSGVSGGRR